MDCGLDLCKSWPLGSFLGLIINILGNQAQTATVKLRTAKSRPRSVGD